MQLSRSPVTAGLGSISPAYRDPGSALSAWGVLCRFLRFLAAERPVPGDPARLRAAHLDQFRAHRAATVTPAGTLREMRQLLALLGQEPLRGRLAGEVTDYLGRRWTDPRQAGRPGYSGGELARIPSRLEALAPPTSSPPPAKRWPCTTSGSAPAAGDCAPGVLEEFLACCEREHRPLPRFRGQVNATFLARKPGCYPSTLRRSRLLAAAAARIGVDTGTYLDTPVTFCLLGLMKGRAGKTGIWSGAGRTGCSCSAWQIARLDTKAW